MSKSGQKTDANPLVARRNFRVAYWLCFITAIMLVLVYIFQSSYPDFMYTFSNVFPPFIATVAVLSSFFALRNYWDNIGSRLSKIWLCFTLGMFFWFLGELGWAIYTMVLNVEIPYPSIADIFWLSGYAPMFIALLLYIKIIQPAISARMFFASAPLLHV